MQRLTWYLNRLGRMSAAEILWRAGRVVRMAAQRVRPAGPARAPQLDPDTADPGAKFIHVPRNIDPAGYRQEAWRILRGYVTVFELTDCWLGRPPHWNRDPRTGRIAPLVPAATLDYRNEELVGDIKYLWEPNRHLHLVRLAQIYALTGERIYGQQVMKQIDSWISQCPPGLGPNWASALEIGIRLINWSLAWQLLGGARSALFADPAGRAMRQRWLDSVYLQARAVANNLSRFSSANNHLIGETAGVWVAAVTWPYWEEVRGWGRHCREVLEQEALLQNAPDGGNREQALSYQRFVFDFLLLAALAGRAAGEEFPAAYWERLEAMAVFVAAMSDVAGNVPMIGDSDDGSVVALVPAEEFQPFRSLIATAAALFRRQDLAGKAGGGPDEKTLWLLGDQAGTLPEPVRFYPLRSFPDCGYYLLGEQFETDEEVRMIVDAGPLGYLSLAAHGHADALSVLLNVGGQEVLIDPGTYAYHTEPRWRAYFRGTRAHNTVMIDGQDQSEQAGNFMWSRHARARCLEFVSERRQQRFVGEHDGYMRLGDPLVHRRRIEYDMRNHSFRIADTLVCKCPHRASRPWHFSELLQPQVEGHRVQVRAGRFMIVLEASEPPQRVSVYRGGSPQEGGWISRQFGRKQACTTVVWDQDIRRETTLETVIRIASAGS